MKTNIAVFFGCRSVEHEVSIISAVQAMRAINTNKYDVTPVYVDKKGVMHTSNALFDIESYKDFNKLFERCDKVTLIKNDDGVYLHYLENGLFKKKKDKKIDLGFPIVHGTNCEDGTMAGLMEFYGLPYISCDIISAAVGMDKAVFKNVLSAASLPVLDCVVFSSREYALNRENVIVDITKNVGFPLIIKPVNLGSSVGISKVDNEDELIAAIDLAAQFADKILAEKAITNLREINCSVLGDRDECIASVCEEPFTSNAILSYEDKYLSSSKNSKTGTASKGMASLGRKIPADIPEDKSEEIRELSVKIFKSLGCSGVVRIDFLLDCDTNKVYANEINTIPGSLAFYLWEASGVKYSEMIDRLIEVAFRRQRNRDNLTFAIDTNILAGVTLSSAKGAKRVKF